jgi:hypothetical protein
MHEPLRDKLSIEQSAESRRFWLIAVALAVIGMLVFRQSYMTFIEPHYPTSFDQLTLLHKFYGIYYDTLGDSERSAFARVAATLKQFVDFKGWVLPAVGTTLALLFGPYRDVFLMTNYLFLVLAGGVLLWTLRRRLGTSFAFAGLGLVLLSNSLYFWAGGLTDMRFDCAGLATFGVFFLTLWFFGVLGGPKAFRLIVLAYALTLLTRSASGVYGLCSVGVFGLVCTAAWASTRRPGWRSRWFATLWIGIALATLFLVFFAIHYREIKAYYIQLLLTPEDAIRLKEFGVGSRAELLLYYLRSFWGHFSGMIIAGGVLIAGHLLIRLFSTWPLHLTTIGNGVLSSAAQFKVPLLIGASFLIGTLIPLSLYSPSPVVIGALTVPLAVTVITVCGAVGVPRGPRWTKIATQLLHGAMLVAGFAFFVIENMSHVPWPTATLNWARGQNALLSQLARDHSDAGGTVAWLTLVDGLNAAVLSVFLYETGRYDAVPRLHVTGIGLFALQMPDLLQRIAGADAVVAHRDFPSLPLPYPSLVSLRDTQTEWQGILDREFVLRAVAQMPSTTFGYYSRPATVAAVTGPYGVEYDSTRKRPRDAWVWVDANPAEVSLRGLSNAEIPVTLGFDAVPGPGIVSGLELAISCDNATCMPQHVVPDGPPPWHLRVPLKLSPGMQIFRFTAAVRQPVSTGQPAGVPLARIGHPHLIWNDH